ncbi:MAG: flavin reductase family protein [Pseudomonadota bacterium]
MPSFDMSTLTKKQSYKLMTGAIVPRPIAWVSTISADGVYNLAPFSFFNGVAVMPPTIGFSIGLDGDGFKDTYNNLMVNRECVVNVVTDPTALAMNTSAKSFPPETDEFAQAGVTPLASEKVAPPRVAESPIQFECTLNQTVTLQNELGRTDLMLCTIVMTHVHEDVYAGDHKIDPHAYPAVGRMGGTFYINSDHLFNMTRYHAIEGDKDV